MVPLSKSGSRFAAARDPILNVAWSSGLRARGPWEGIQPCWSGLQVQGTASSPPSTAREGYRGWTGEATAAPSTRWAMAAVGRRASKAKAALEDRSERTARCVSEDRTRQRADGAASGRRVAERAGFEPATGFPEPHFQCGAIGH